MAQSGHKATAEGSLEGTRSLESSALSAAVEGPRCSGGESAPCCASSSSDPAHSSEYFSTRIASMIESRSVYETAVEAEIEASKVHWSELRQSEGDEQGRAEANKAFFRSLQQQYGGPEDGFFIDGLDNAFELGEKIAEGAQGAIYRVKHRISGEISDQWVVKVFKLEGWSLEDLQKQWPPGMLKVILDDVVYGGRGISGLLRGVMLNDGRFGFVMVRYWGDLRKVIDDRMKHNGNQASPFNDAEVFIIMGGLAMGMEGLHRNGIVHRDLKASNVLILPKTWDIKQGFFGEFVSTGDDWFHVFIADYECSVGVVGTRFWRAPEILLGVKNRCCQPSLFTEKSDVYSYAMTCYEILTGKIPLEDERSNDYDVVVLGGKRSELPSGTHPWIRSMLNRCWHQSPSERPSSEEIVEKFVDIGKRIIEIQEKCGEVSVEQWNDLLKNKF